jgi:spermidine synthase
MARFLLGDRTIAIAILLFIFISCLGVGSLVSSRLAAKFRVKTRAQALDLIAVTLIAGGILHLVLVPLAREMVLAHSIALPGILWTHSLLRIIIGLVLIGPPVLLLGLVFPLLIWSSDRINAAPGAVVGGLYFINTLGAFLGATVASLIMSRLLGTMGGFLAMTGLLVLAGSLLLLKRTRGRLQAVALVAMAVTALVGSWYPFNLVQLRSDEKIVVANEDEYGVQVLAKSKLGRLRVRNNRIQLIYDLGHPQTTYAQQMAAHLAVLLTRNAADVLNIGTGYGITAGTFTLYPDILSIETVEILPFLLRQQQRFDPFNFGYFNDPRVKMTVGDGRQTLINSDQRYDVISVNVLDPYLPGSSSLYTVDFWKLARQRLKPGGVMTQLLWGKDLPVLVKGLQSVFPTVLYFSAYGDTSFNAVAFKEPVEDPTPNLGRLSRAAASQVEMLVPESTADHISKLMRESRENGAKLRRLARDAPVRLHTDNDPVLEYRWAHGVKGVSIFDSPLVEQ